VKTAALWDITPRSLVEENRRFRAFALMMEAVSASETPVFFYETARRNIRED
jgi:hypothetical protein